MNSKQFKKLLLRTISRVLLASGFYLAASTSGFAVSVDDGTLAFQSGNYDGALANLLPIARQGNAEASYLVGKIYSIKAEGSQDYMPKAVFWLLYARHLGNRNGDQILRRYVREGHRQYVRMTELRIDDDAGYRYRSKNPDTFPNTALTESEQFWKWTGGQLSKSDLKIERNKRMAELSDLDLCRDALNLRLNGWDENIYSAEEVDEVALRNLTIEDCNKLLTAAVTPN